MASLIEERFARNIERVRNIVGLYEVVAGTTQGRPTVQESDLLRAAIVLLHAAVEDLLRSIAEDRLPHASAEVLGAMPFPTGTQRKTTFTLGELAAFRGQTVDRVIRQSVSAYLARSSFNHPGDIRELLEDIGVNSKLVDSYAASLANMMSRRHLIVHRADRNDAAGSGQHSARSIGKLDVRTWIDTVERFGADLLGTL